MGYGKSMGVVWSALLMVALLMGHDSVSAEALSARAAVEATEVFVGQAFQFQIQVSGSETPAPPDLSALGDFQVQPQGGQRNSSRSVSIVNGHMSQVVHLGYVFVYQLTARRAGRLMIPAITVHAAGSSTRTQAVLITARQPAETEDFKLRMQLSATQCYVGQPVILTVTWYIGQDVRGFAFALPLLAEPSLTFADPPVQAGPGEELYRIPLGGGEVIGRKARGRLDGRDYATLSFQRVLIPQRPGTLEIAPATVSCEVLTGYRRGRSRLGDRFFDSFFDDDFFGRGNRGVYRKLAVPSNSLTLKVSALPAAGRPAHFAGHVGPYHITAAATPTTVKVGDPITLTVTLSGPEYLEGVDLPPLCQQPALVAGFKVPSQRAPGETRDGTRVFTQTVRALRPDVREIPPIELPYFDTRDGTYRVARSAPIPLEVTAARIVTARDAEGLTPTPVGNALEAWSAGIAHNYEDPGCLEDQRYGLLVWAAQPTMVALLAAFPGFFLLAFAGTALMRRRRSDPLALRRRGAYKRAAQTVSAAAKQPSRQACEICLKALAGYLGDQLGLASQALTFADVQGPLQARGVDEQTLESLGSLFTTCEAGRYAGDSGTADATTVAQQTAQVLDSLEQCLK